jgi:hypothetical protein
MKNGTLNRMLLAMVIAFAFALSGCIAPEETDAIRNSGDEEVVLEPIAFDAAALMDGKTWALNCLSAENEDMQQACSDFVAAQPTQYTRTLLAVEDGEPVVGLATWRAQSDFLGCGGIDLNNDELGFIEADGIDIDEASLVLGASYADDQVACQTDSGLAPETFEDIVNHHGITGLRTEELAYQYEEGNTYQIAPDCQYSEVKSVSLLSYDGINLVAVVIRNDQAIEFVPGACSGVTPVVGNYVVGMTQQ